MNIQPCFRLTCLPYDYSLRRQCQHALIRSKFTFSFINNYIKLFLKFVNLRKLIHRTELLEYLKKEHGEVKKIHLF